MHKSKKSIKISFLYFLSYFQCLFHLLIFSDYNVYVNFRVICFLLMFIIILRIGLRRRDIYLSFVAACLTFFYIFLYGFNGLLYFVASCFYLFFLIKVVLIFETFKRAIFFASITILLMSFVSIYIDIGVETYELRIGRSISQFSGVMASPNYIGFLAFLSITTNSAFVSIFKRISNNVWLIFGFMSQSRAFLANLLSHFIRSIFFHRGYSRLIKYGLATIIICFFVYLFSLNLFYVADLEENRLGSRAVVLNSFINLYEAGRIPLIGYGYGTSNEVMEIYFDYSFSFHSSFLNLLIDFGLLGLIFSVSIIMFSFVLDIKNLNKSRFILTSLVLYGLLTAVFEYPMSLIGFFFWFLFIGQMHAKYIYDRFTV